MRVVAMLWIMIAHISILIDRYSAARRCAGVQISISFGAYKMLASDQHLGQLRVVVRKQGALAQLIEEPAEPEAAHSDHRGGVIDVTRERQPVMRDLLPILAFEFR